MCNTLYIIVYRTSNAAKLDFRKPHTPMEMYNLHFTRIVCVEYMYQSKSNLFKYSNLYVICISLDDTASYPYIFKIENSRNIFSSRATAYVSICNLICGV